jgi:flagellar motor switch protein FliM
MNANLLTSKARSVDPAILLKRIKTYDFRRPDKFSKEQIRTVQNIHKSFARLATTTLSAMMRALVQVCVASVDQMTYEEFIRSIPNPGTIGVFGMDPLRGMAVLEIDPSIAFSCMDRLFGGTVGGAADGSGEKTDPKRGLTDIEQSVMEGVFLRLLGNLRESWAQVLDLRPRLAQIETNPLFAQIVPPSEMVILVNLEMKLGETIGMLNLCIPYMTIEPIISRLSAQYWYSTRRPVSKESLKSILGHIETFDIEAEVLVEGENLSLRELGALKKGSLVRLPGLERGEALFRMGECDLFRMRAQPKRRDKAQEYEIIEKLFEETIPSLESAETPALSGELESTLRDALAEFRSALSDQLADLAKSVSELGRRQDLLADQLALAPPEVEGEDEAGHPEHRRPFEFLARADPVHVLNFLAGEHPQAIALILSYLEAHTASALFGGLSAELQPNVARRIAAMDRTMPEVVRQVERVLERKLEAMSSEKYTEAGGVRSVVDILNMTDRATEKHVVESLERSDSGLADEIKKRMFIFEDLVRLEANAVLKLIEGLDAETLVRAMKASSDELKSFIWACLPEHTSAALKARLEKLGMIRLAEIDAAQQKVVARIREMEESGEIVIKQP